MLIQKITVRISGAAMLIVMMSLLARPVSADDPTPKVTPTLGASPTAQVAPPVPTFSTTPVVLRVDGTVTSGTAGLDLPANLPLTLHIARASQPTGTLSEVTTRNAVLSADHTFTFDNLISIPGDLVAVTTTFAGVVQGSPVIQVANGQIKGSAPITLYGVTHDSKVITLLSVQHILDFEQGNILQVLATYNYKNTSDQLYLSDEQSVTGVPVSVKIPLPIGARSIAFNTQPVSRFALGGDPNAVIVQDTKAVTPGQVQDIVFSYQVPYSQGAAIDQDYPYATSDVEVLIPNDINVGIAEDRFNVTSDTSINPRRTYTRYSLNTPLKAGDRLIYTLGGAAQIAQRPVTQNSGPLSNGLRFGEAVVVALFAVTVVGIALTIIGRQGSKKRPPRKVPSKPTPPKKP